MNSCYFYEQDIPSHIIVGLENELREFNSVVDKLTLPTIDMDACMEQIITNISISSSSYEFTNRVISMAEWMSKGEGLYENSRLDAYEKETLYNAIIKVSMGINDKINYLNIYIDGFLPYMFYKMHGKEAMVLHLNSENC